MTHAIKAGTDYGRAKERKTHPFREIFIQLIGASGASRSEEGTFGRNLGSSDGTCRSPMPNSDLLPLGSPVFSVVPTVTEAEHRSKAISGHSGSISLSCLISPGSAVHPSLIFASAAEFFYRILSGLTP